MLVTSIVSFSHNAFHPIKGKYNLLSDNEFVVLKYLKSGPVQNSVVWLRIKIQNNIFEFIPFGVIVPRMCIQEVSFKSLFQLFDTFSIGINEKSWMLCPGELKCSETLVNMSGKCTISNLCDICDGHTCINKNLTNEF